MSVLNRVGCVVTWVTWVHGSRGLVSAWVAWVNFLRRLRGLRASEYFLRGSTFYVGHNFYVGCVGQIYFCVGQFIWRGPLRGSNIFTWVQNFCVGQFFFFFFALVNVCFFRRDYFTILQLIA